jgi:hypothetical protein
MKNKISVISLTISLFISLPAFAQDGSGEEKFLANKVNIIDHLKQKKAIIDKEISCINSASRKEDAKNCHERARGSMDKLRQQRINKRKDHLKEQLRKLDEKSSKISNRRNRD